VEIEMGNVGFTPSTQRSRAPSSVPLARSEAHPPALAY
jgi:hypothetical protein